MYHQDSDFEATVAGMGKIYQSKGSCFTESGGPSPFQKCKFPFFAFSNSRASNGSSSSSTGIKYKRCSKSTHPPINEVKVCKDFFEKVAALNLRDFPNKYEVDIEMPDGRVQRCFDVQPLQAKDSNYFRFVLHSSAAITVFHPPFSCPHC